MKLTDAMVEGLRGLARHIMPRTNTVQALQRRGLVGEDLEITDAGWDAYAEHFPSEAAGYRAAQTAEITTGEAVQANYGEGHGWHTGRVVGVRDGLFRVLDDSTNSGADFHPVNVRRLTVRGPWNRGKRAS